MMHGNVHPHHKACPQEIHECPKGAQAWGFDFGLDGEYDLVYEGGGTLVYFYCHGNLYDVYFFTVQCYINVSEEVPK